MISEIFRGEYPLPGTTKKAIYTEYWLPSRELLQEPSLRVTVELRVQEELERYYRQVATRDWPEFDPILMHGRWFSYDWDKRSFSNAPSDVLAPDERMRG